MSRYFALAVVMLAFALPLVAADDIVVADFEGESYGKWQSSGEAFGTKPAAGTLQMQLPVSGFRGAGLVNSYRGGDKTKGTLTSPPFLVQRRYLSFLVGGGGHQDRTCVNLLHDGKVVRTRTGAHHPTERREKLEPAMWDLKDLLGQSVSIQIVDKASGSWGHINVDHIVLTDKKPQLPVAQTKRLVLSKNYLLFPIHEEATTCAVDLMINGVEVREFDAQLAPTIDKIDFWAFLDLSPFQGRQARLELSSATEKTLALIRTADEIPATSHLYDEPLRPQFHFSQRVGWNNCPNGMVHYDGEWHLFFQHNPYGRGWGNMQWGHAVSTDLVHWEQLPVAIYNKSRGDWAFSGSAIVDVDNTAGWQTGDEKVIVACWTSTGRGECIAYSNDRGRTFTEYEGNPVVKHAGRDPKVFWYAAGRHWVMAVFQEQKGRGGTAFYVSKNLKHWEFSSHIGGNGACPEIYPLPVDGQQSNLRWVLSSGPRYMVGDFDGRSFKPAHQGTHRVHYGRCATPQTFNHAPDGRRIQIGWASIPMERMPFNQTFTFPHNLTLRTTDDGVRLFAQPVREIEQLYGRRYQIEAGRHALAENASEELVLGAETIDLHAVFEIGQAKKVGLNIGGNLVVYDVLKQQLQGARVRSQEGRIAIRVLVDRPMLEIIANRGSVSITAPRAKRGNVGKVIAFAEGGQAWLRELRAYELKSIWKR